MVSMQASESSTVPSLLNVRIEDGKRSARAWQRSALRGDLVKLAHGVYYPLDSWFEAAPWDRFRLAALAHAASRRGEAVFSGLTALFLHGLPLAYPPSSLHLRAASQGSSRSRKQPLPYLNGQAAAERFRQTMARLGRPHRGVLPVLPAITARWTALGPSSTPQPVLVRCTDGTPLGQVLADPLPLAMAEVFSDVGVEVSAVPADALKRDHATEAESWAGEAVDLLGSQAARLRFRTTWAFANPQSESPGESLSRARMQVLGFVIPELQHGFRSADGTVFARSDYWWDDVGLAGEFDGLVKYSRELAAPGRTPQDSLAAEKRREDRIRATGAGMVRWIWSDLHSSRGFAALLDEHRVPRRNRHRP